MHRIPNLRDVVLLLPSFYIAIDTFLTKNEIHINMHEILQRTSNCVILGKHWQRIYNDYA